MPAQTTGSLTTTDSVVLTKPATDTVAYLAVSGTYGTVTFVVEGSIDGSNYFPLMAVALSNGAVVTGTVSPADNAELGYKVMADGLSRVRLRTTAVGSGTVEVAINSMSVVGGLQPTNTQLSSMTFGATTYTGKVLLGDSVKLALGDSDDVTMAWDGTDLDVLQATANSSIKWGIDGAGIDQVWYGDTASTSLTWDQSADSLIHTGATRTVYTGTTGQAETHVTDNLADALSVKIVGGNDLLVYKTTNSDEAVQVAAALELTQAATLAAAGSAQGDAAAIVNQITYVSGADGTVGVRLPAATAGRVHFIYNLHATNGLKVYPASGDDINDGSADAAVTIEGKTLMLAVALDTATWGAIFTANS